MIITAMPRVTPRMEITVMTETNERFGFRYRRARKREKREVTVDSDGLVLAPD
jgi:hypothetical protein